MFNCTDWDKSGRTFNHACLLPHECGVPFAVPKDAPVQPESTFVVDKSGQLQ